MGAEPALETGRLKNTCVNLRNELLRPTYGYLERVEEGVARNEVGPLRYMGYRNAVDAK